VGFGEEENQEGGIEPPCVLEAGGGHQHLAPMRLDLSQLLVVDGVSDVENLSDIVQEVAHLISLFVGGGWVSISHAPLIWIVGVWDTDSLG